MHIGLDCRTLLAHKTGDRTYALNLVRGLAELCSCGELPPDWTFHLLLDEEDAEGIVPRASTFKTVVLPTPRGSGRLWTLWSLPRYAREANLGLVHVQYLAPLSLPCPYLTTIHDVVWRALPHTFPRRDRLVMRALMPTTVRHARRVITGTQAARRDIARFLPVAKRRVIVTPYAIDPVFSQPVQPEEVARVRAKYGLADVPYLLSVGVLQPRKNVPRLIEAFQEFQRRHPDAPHKLAIVGKHGWGDATLRLNSPGIVTTGYVPDEELPALYAGAEVFCYPSLYEGFGLPVLEAMACGAPVLTSNVSCLPEVAGGAAHLVNPYSVTAIADGLEQLLGDLTLRDELRHKGQARAAQFTPQRQARATCEVYQSVLRGSGGPGRGQFPLSSSRRA